MGINRSNMDEESMSELCKYLIYCFNQTFYNFPKEKIESIKQYFDDAIKKTILDANIKYKGRKEICNVKELMDLVQLEPTMEAVMLYRIEREIYLKDQLHPLLSYLASLMHRRTGCEIYYSTDIGKGFNIQHGFGIVIGPRNKIGDNFIVHQGVTIGQKHINSPNEKMTIGDNVVVFSGATILGNIRIGNNSCIGANSVLLSNVEANSIYAGIPAKRIK